VHGLVSLGPAILTDGSMVVHGEVRVGQTDDKLPIDDAPPQLVGIRVDVDDLASFASLLNRELTLNLGPGARKVIGEHVHGPGFGWNTVSEQVAATHSAYAYALEVSCHNMSQYIRWSEILIQAIAEAHSAYRHSDMSADQMFKLISDGIAAVDKHRVVNSSWDPDQPHGMAM
jgi:hypothetical protein